MTASVQLPRGQSVCFVTRLSICVTLLHEVLLDIKYFVGSPKDVLKMEAVYSFGHLVPNYRSTRSHNAEDRNLKLTVSYFLSPVYLTYT